MNVNRVNQCAVCQSNHSLFLLSVTKIIAQQS